MARLRVETLERLEHYADRVLDVVGELERQKRNRRIVDQLAGSGPSVGANGFEADEAMSRSDFVKCLCIVMKELNETKFWLRLVSRRGWISSKRLEPLLVETIELKSMFSAMIIRTRRRSK
jgi:four helix bundle protein